MRQRGQLSFRKARACFDLHHDERRAIAQRARIVLIAGRLVDTHLLAERRRHGLQTHAVRLRHAVATALANFLVDDEPLGGLNAFAA